MISPVHHLALAVCAASAIALASPAAVAQEVNLATLSTTRPNIVLVRTGLDNALFAKLGYRRVVELVSRLAIVGVDATIPWAEPDARDYALDISIALPILDGRRLKLVGQATPTVRGTNNVLNRMISLGADLRLVGGYYSRRWFAAAELGLDWSMATHVHHSDAYRDTIYSDAEDGWYRSPGGTSYAGLNGGLSFSQFDVVMRLGEQRGIQLEDQTVPFYLTIGANFHFD